MSGNIQHNEKGCLLPEAALQEVVNLQRRNDWIKKIELIGFNLIMSFLCLLGIPLGFFIARMEPSDTILPISLFGFILMLAGPIGFIYFAIKAGYFFLKPFDAKSFFEYLMNVTNVLNFRYEEKLVGKIIIPWELIIPSGRDKYWDFYRAFRAICEREIQRCGSGFIKCKRCRVKISQDGHQATCVVELMRELLPSSTEEKPFGKLTLKTVKSKSGNWYLVVPNPEKAEFCLEFE